MKQLNKNNEPQLGAMCPAGRSCSNAARYPGFPFPASEVEEYICGIDFIIVATIHKVVKRHNTPDPQAIRHWLTAHGIPDITSQVGSMVLNYYSGKG